MSLSALSLPLSEVSFEALCEALLLCEGKGASHGTGLESQSGVGEQGTDRTPPLLVALHRALLKHVLPEKKMLDNSATSMLSAVMASGKRDRAPRTEDRDALHNIMRYGSEIAAPAGRKQLRMWGAAEAQLQQRLTSAWTRGRRAAAAARRRHRQRRRHRRRVVVSAAADTLGI